MKHTVAPVAKVAGGRRKGPPHFSVVLLLLFAAPAFNIPGGAAPFAAAASTFGDFNCNDQLTKICAPLTSEYVAKPQPMAVLAAEGFIFVQWGSLRLIQRCTMRTSGCTPFISPVSQNTTMTSAGMVSAGPGTMVVVDSQYLLSCSTQTNNTCTILGTAPYGGDTGQKNSMYFVGGQALVVAQGYVYASEVV